MTSRGSRRRLLSGNEFSFAVRFQSRKNFESPQNAGFRLSGVHDMELASHAKNGNFVARTWKSLRPISCWMADSI